MDTRTFIGLLVVVVIGFVGFTVAKPKPKQSEALVGVVSHVNQGQEHITQGQKHKPYNSDLPSSGPHYNDNNAPTPWGVYTQEVPSEVFVHNEEHGGVIIAYKPDLPKDQIAKLQHLFAPPYSDKNFAPIKAILMPRAENKQPIQMASWTRTFSLDSYDQAKIEKFYLNNVNNGRAPESYAGPTNTPINQAAN